MQLTGQETKLSRISSHCRHFVLLQTQTFDELAGQKKEKKEEKTPKLKAHSSVGVKEQVSPKTSGDVFINTVRSFTPKALTSHPWFVPMKHFIYEEVSMGLTNNE